MYTHVDLLPGHLYLLKDENIVGQAGLRFDLGSGEFRFAWVQVGGRNIPTRMCVLFHLEGNSGMFLCGDRYIYRTSSLSSFPSIYSFMLLCSVTK